MDRSKLYKLLTEFLESGDFSWLHIKTEGPDGRKEFFYTKPEQSENDVQNNIQAESEVMQENNETLREKIQRIMQSETLNGSELEWWKEVQLKLGPENQIQREDTVDMALEKLARIGLID